jgi:protein FrlC
LKTSLLTSLYKNYALEDAIQQIAVAGFDAVEIWGGRPHAYPDDMRKHDIQHIRSLMDDQGLEIAAVFPAQYHYPCCLCSPAVKVRIESVHYLMDSIELAVRLGAPVVIICPSHTLHNQHPDSAWELLADSLIRLCEFSSHYNILLAIEPSDKHATDMINTNIQAMDMIDQIGCDNLGVSFNTGHSLLVGEDAATVIENLGDRLFHVHINDNDGKQDQHLIPGQGQFDFQSMVQALRMTSFDGCMSADLGWGYLNNPNPAANETQEFLENLVNR